MFTNKKNSALISLRFQNQHCRRLRQDITLQLSRKYYFSKFPLSKPLINVFVWNKNYSFNRYKTAEGSINEGCNKLPGRSIATLNPGLAVILIPHCTVLAPRTPTVHGPETLKGLDGTIWVAMR
jgi:hypothetical protein